MLKTYHNPTIQRLSLFTHSPFRHFLLNKYWLNMHDLKLISGECFKYLDTIKYDKMGVTVKAVIQMKQFCLLVFHWSEGRSRQQGYGRSNPSGIASTFNFTILHFSSWGKGIFCTFCSPLGSPAGRLLCFSLQDNQPCRATPVMYGVLPHVAIQLVIATHPLTS